MQRLLYTFILSLFFSFCSNTPINHKKTLPNNSVANFNPLTPSQIEYYQQLIKPLYNNLLVSSGFNGGIIIAKNGQIIFEDYRGYYNYATKELITSNTPFHIASVSKTFTAIAVLKLMEEQKIYLDADVRNYLPNFPYENISIKMLLNHRSGLSNYVNDLDGSTTIRVTKKNKRGKWITVNQTVADKSKTFNFITNEDVLTNIINGKVKQETKPNTHFKYCNTNYALLALVIESVTKVDFPTYAKQQIFEPLGMKNSYVFSSNNTNNYVPSYKYNFAPYTIEKLDCVYGDKNIYSTPQDMLQWDKALYSESFIKQTSLKLAFAPYSFERPGTRNYGLGFRLLVYPTQTIPYHNGWWHGNNAAFTRLINDTATIIVLGNKYNERIYKSKEFAFIFNSLHPASDTSKLEE